MNLWVDDVRVAPVGYTWVRSVNAAKKMIEQQERKFKKSGRPADRVELLDLDHDAGDYASAGGDYIRLLDWMEETGRSYPIRLHTMNPVGRDNMMRIVRRNKWPVVM